MESSKGIEKARKNVDDGLLTAVCQNVCKMELLLYKLKLLGIEEESGGSQLTIEPISKHYFATSTNVAQQFWTMISLAAWLIRKCGNQSYPQPVEDEDPNATITNLLEEMKKMGIRVDYSSNRLKIGSGEQCLRLLTALADEAMAKTHFAFQRPIVDEKALSEMVVDQRNHQEVIPELYVEEENDEVSSDLDITDISPGFKQSSLSAASAQGKQLTDDELRSFQQELERVTPMLKINVALESENWKNFGKQLTTVNEAMMQFNAGLIEPLTQLSGGIQQTMKKIELKESLMNDRMEGDLAEIQKIRNQLAEIKETYRIASADLVEKSVTLSTLDEALIETKEFLEDRMNQLADGAPLVKIKQAIARLKQDIVVLQLQITIIQRHIYQTLLNKHRINA